jgi:outer membrane phospholipase A
VPEEYLETNSGDEFKDESYSEQLTHAYASVHILEKLNIPHRYVTSEKELADPRANNKELFSKLVSRETNNSAKLPEKYTIKFEIYKGMGDNNIPIFDETTAVVTATSFENANLKADELTFNVATKYNVDGMAVGIVSITNQHGKVY